MIYIVHVHDDQESLCHLDSYIKGQRYYNIIHLYRLFENIVAVLGNNLSRTRQTTYKDARQSFRVTDSTETSRITFWCPTIKSSELMVSSAKCPRDEATCYFCYYLTPENAFRIFRQIRSKKSYVLRISSSSSPK